MMDIKQIDIKLTIEGDKKLTNQFVNLEKLINELKKREIPLKVVNSVNENIEKINSLSGSRKDLRKQIYKSQSYILKLIESELNLVPKNLYRTRWMVIGMLIFGVPLGVTFGASLGNMAFLAIGIPIGMLIGMAIGAEMDKKAFEEGRQIEFETKY